MAPKHKPRTATKAVGKCKKKANKKTTTIPAWECPKCGACHPITVTVCCAPKPPAGIRPRLPFQPFQPGIIPRMPNRPLEEWPKSPPQRWTWPPDITCTVHPSAGPDYQNSGFREVTP